MLSSLKRSKQSCAQRRFVAHWLLLVLLQQAMFATGTMAGSGLDGSGWVTLCTGSSDVAQLVYIGDKDQQAPHAETEQCLFSATVLATSDAAAQISSTTLFYTRHQAPHSDTSNPTSRFKLPRAPPFRLS